MTAPTASLEATILLLVDSQDNRRNRLAAHLTQALPGLTVIPVATVDAAKGAFFSRRPSLVVVYSSVQKDANSLAGFSVTTGFTRWIQDNRGIKSNQIVPVATRIKHIDSLRRQSCPVIYRPANVAEQLPRLIRRLVEPARVLLVGSGPQATYSAFLQQLAGVITFDVMSIELAKELLADPQWHINIIGVGPKLAPGTGLEFIQSIRADTSSDHIRILGISPDPSAHAALLSAGAEQALTPDELIDRMGRGYWP
jgi:hypothetical protein